MKTFSKIFMIIGIYFAIVTASISITSCSNSTEPEDEVVITKSQIERNFAKNSALTEDANKVIILHLESTLSPEQDDTVDTGTIGIDEVSLNFSDASHTFKLEGDCDYLFQIVSSDGQEVLHTLNEESRLGTFNVSGEYLIRLTSTLEYSTSEPGMQHIFIRPDDTATNGFIVTNNTCRDEDLSGSDLSYENFDYVDFSNSIFDNSVIVNASFRYAILVNTSFQECNLFATRMVRTDIRNATFYGSNLDYSYFSYAKALGTNFCNTKRYGMVIAGVEQDQTTKCSLNE